ncbi:A24 family peptidase [Rothia terrae]|uniref:A24 family peptidase n=1 Tax=Rothia terrae TaxID=396015 RepID=UPI00288164B0|nr:A24 family peptidase [Rothia terrae]MDT0190380.1 A24 family peptidase [Rothia terrae]
MFARIYEFASYGNTVGWVCAVLLILTSVYFAVCAVELWRIDVAIHRLPDKIVLPMYAVIGAALFTVLVLTEGAEGLRRTSYSAVVLLGIYWVLRMISRRSLGLGDVKLAGVLGLLMGYFSALNILWGTMLAFVFGGCYGLYLVLTKKASLKTHIPFGPFMLAGATVALVFPA